MIYPKTLCNTLLELLRPPAKTHPTLEGTLGSRLKLAGYYEPRNTAFANQTALLGDS